MTRTSRAVVGRSRTIVAALVVLAALAGGLGAAAAAPADGAAGQSAATAAVAAAQEDCSFPVTETDATGNEVTLEEQPEDVVVLAPSSAQTVWEIGESDRVVGMPVASSTSYLEGSEERTQVLDGTTVLTETVVDLDPDLVIAPGGDLIGDESLQQLRDAGLTVYVEDPASSLDAIRNNTRTVGRLLGACDAAGETVDWMDERLATVDEAVEGAEDRPSVFYWLPGGYTAGAGTFQGDLIERAGATNAAANMSIQGWDVANPESIVAEDPDYVLLEEGVDLPRDHAIQQTTAVQEGRILRVDSNDWNQAAPRVVLAVENVTAQLHGDALEDARSSDEAGGNSIPGFGVPAAVAVLLGGGVALGRRD